MTEALTQTDEPTAPVEDTHAPTKTDEKEEKKKIRKHHKPSRRVGAVVVEVGFEDLMRLAAEEGFKPEVKQHGTVYSYRKVGCRCTACSTAQKLTQRKYREALYADELPENDSRHGSVNAYTNFGCRCEKCTAANTAMYQKKRSRGRPRKKRTA